MRIVEICNKDIISFPSLPSTKQGHESKGTKTKSFVFVVPLKRTFWNVLTKGTWYELFFLEFFLGGVTLLIYHLVYFEFIEGLQCTLQVYCDQNKINLKDV